LVKTTVAEVSRLSAQRRRPDGDDGGSRLLEADDVARYLGMRTDWVYREVRAGRLPHIRLGRAVRFRRDSIEAWLTARERGASSQRP
jgi:excisionase family DNA binding protein